MVNDRIRNPGYDMKLTTTKATKIATESALRSTEKHRIGAILFCGNQYVTSCNRTFSGVITNRQTKYSEHAEASAINHAIHLGFDLTKSTLIVVRVNNKGSLMLACPCIHCQRIIKRENISRVYFSSDPLRRQLIPENFKSL